jgi:LPXTG-motif cell wall-anchored protein
LEQGNANNGGITEVSIINPVGAQYTVTQSCVGQRFSAADTTATCGVVVTCTPTAVGAVTGDLFVELTRDNGATPPPSVSIPLTCNGVDAPVPPPPGEATPVPTLGAMGLSGLGLLLAGGGLAAMRRRRNR